MKKIVLALTLSGLILTSCGPQAAQTQISNNDTTTSTESQSQKETKQKESSYRFDGEVAEIHDVKIEITDHKVLQPGEKGNEYGDQPVIAFWYKATNKTDKDIDPNSAWFAIFTAIQDNDPNMVNELSVGTLPDDRFLQSQMNTIKKNGTVENAVAYELTDEETPVTLKASQGIGGNPIGEFTYTIK